MGRNTEFADVPGDHPDGERPAPTEQSPATLDAHFDRLSQEYEEQREIDASNSGGHSEEVAPPLEPQSPADSRFDLQLSNRPVFPLVQVNKDSAKAWLGGIFLAPPIAFLSGAMILGPVLQGSTPFAFGIFGLTASELGTIIVLLLTVLSVVVCFVMYLRARRPEWGTDPRQRPVDELFQKHSWGTPGEGLEYDAPAVFGSANVASGVLGERLTGAVLDLFIDQQTWVFHGMPWPGSAAADVDHILCCGQLVLTIDSKYWAAGTYELANDGRTLLRNGAPFAGGDLKFSAARDAWSAQLPGRRVVAIVVIHNEGAGIKFDGPFDSLMTSDGVLVCSSTGLFDVLENLVTPYWPQENDWPALEHLLKWWYTNNSEILSPLLPPHMTVIDDLSGVGNEVTLHRHANGATYFA